jgi:hypothetical protein
MKITFTVYATPRKIIFHESWRFRKWAKHKDEILTAFANATANKHHAVEIYITGKATDTDRKAIWQAIWDTIDYRNYYKSTTVRGYYEQGHRNNVVSYRTVKYIRKDTEYRKPAKYRRYCTSEYVCRYTG